MSSDPTPQPISRETVAAIGLGLLFGLAFTWLAGELAADFIPVEYLRWLKLLTAAFACFWGVQLLLATSRSPVASPSASLPAGESAAGLLLDTSALIDGRIAELARIGVAADRLDVPPFVLAELQSLADGSDKTRRTRGRRGLDVLEKLRAAAPASLRLLEAIDDGNDAQPVDQRLIDLAKRRRARLVTVDFNLQKVAEIQGVAVVNLNDVAVALKPPCLPGDRLTLEIVRPGEQATQGVGYLEDGTMVVVEGAREFVDRAVRLTVTSVAQTSAGRMVFGRCDGACE